MNDDPTIHKRRSIRLPGYDYSSPGAYFITICTHQHSCIFGDIIDGQMHLNEMGRIAADEWLQTAVIRQEIELDEWGVMPNHFHGIVFIVQTVVGATGGSPVQTGQPPQSRGRSPLRRAPNPNPSGP